MYFAYVLQSEVDHSYFYKGHCTDLGARLKEHHAGYTKSIRHKRPFKVVYYEEFESLDAAIKRERYYKSAAGRRFLARHFDRSSGRAGIAREFTNSYRH